MRLQPRGSVGAKGRAEPSTGNENAKKKKYRKRKQNRQVWKECGQPACVGKVTKQNDDEKNKNDKMINSNESHS